MKGRHSHTHFNLHYTRQQILQHKHYLLSLTMHLQNVLASSSQSTQEFKKSNLKSQNGEIDYKKVNNDRNASICLLSELFISSGKNRKQRTPNSGRR